MAAARPCAGQVGCSGPLEPARPRRTKKERHGPRPGLSAHLPQARKGPRPSEAPPSELPAGSGAALGKRAARGGKETEGEGGREKEPRCSAAAATTRPSGSRAPQAPGGEGKEPSAMATAPAGGEAEQPPPLRVATTLGEGDGREQGGARPRYHPSRPEARSSTGGGDGHRFPMGGTRAWGLLGVVVWRCVLPPSPSPSSLPLLFWSLH